MSVLRFYTDSKVFECTRVSNLNISYFSIKNQYTGESGNPIIYPVKMHKAKISFTAEIQGDYSEFKNFSNFMDIITQPEFKCDFKYPDWVSLKVHVTSDISVTKIMSTNGIKGGLYAVSTALEEV